MSIAIVRNQSAIARLEPSLAAGPQQAAQPANKAAAAPAQAAHSGDPRTLAALSQALASFLDQVNSAAGASPAYRDVAAAYADHGDAAPAPAAAAVEAKPAESGFGGKLDDLKASFDSLFTSLQSAGASAPVSPDAHKQLKADVADFVGGLTRIADELGKPAQKDAAPPAAAGEPTSVATPALAPPVATAAPAETDEARPVPALVRTPLAMQANAAAERPAQRQSVFAQLGERFQRHFEEL